MNLSSLSLNNFSNIFENWNVGFVLSRVRSNENVVWLSSDSDD